jgi:hypothetical protein
MDEVDSEVEETVADRLDVGAGGDFVQAERSRATSRREPHMISRFLLGRRIILTPLRMA